MQGIHQIFTWNSFIETRNEVFSHLVLFLSYILNLCSNLAGSYVNTNRSLMGACSRKNGIMHTLQRHHYVYFSWTFKPTSHASSFWHYFSTITQPLFSYLFLFFGLSNFTLCTMNMLWHYIIVTIIAYLSVEGFLNHLKHLCFEWCQHEWLSVPDALYEWVHQLGD